MQYNYIAIEGNIGVGKTTLATRMAKDLEARLVLERFTENIFLPKFYEEPEKYGLSVELSFLVDRRHQLNELATEQGKVVADYIIDKSLVFAQVNLPKDEYGLFRDIFQIMTQQFRQPDLVIFLHNEVENLQANIRKRGLEFEQKIQDTYLQSVSDSYLSWAKTDLPFPLLFVETKGKDFASDESHYHEILALTAQKWERGLHLIKA